MPRILVLGASGFVGGHLARALLADGHAVRCLARKPAKVPNLATIGSEVVPGDIADRASLHRALQSVDAVYISIHTLSPQPGDTARQGFVDVELTGLTNIVAACQATGVRRLISITSLGISPDARSAWVRGRWEGEQFLLRAGLDVTVIRPGQIVGVGGAGFGMMVGQAKRRVALVLGSGRQRMQNIAIADLIYYLVGVLDDPRTHGQVYEVGGDDILTANQMIDVVAESLDRPHPRKVHLPPALLRALAPLLERVGKLPPGAIRGIADALGMDLIGDPLPIRAILPRPPLSYRQAVARALQEERVRREGA